LTGIDVTFDLNNLEAPYTGTKALKITPTFVTPLLTLDGRFKFTGVLTNVTEGNLIFYIKTTGLTTDSGFIITIGNGVNAAYVTIANTNPYGLSYGSTA